MFAIAFCEDDFDSAAPVKSADAFDAYSSGFEHGAAAYGSGTVRLYLHPRDEAAMIEREHVGEVMRAHEAIERLKSE